MPPKKVTINEDCNKYHNMMEDDDINEIVAEVRNLFDVEETSDASKESLLTELSELKESNKLKEQKFESAERTNGLQRANIELGEVFMSELTDLTNEIRTAFQSVNSDLQQRKDTLWSLEDMEKFVVDQSFLNDLSLERLQAAYETRKAAKDNHLRELNDEMACLKNDREREIAELDAKFDGIIAEHEKVNAETARASEELESAEKACNALRLELARVKQAVGDANLDLQEVNLKRDEMASDFEAFEGGYKKETKELGEKKQELTERLTLEKQQCTEIKTQIEEAQSKRDGLNNDTKHAEEKITVIVKDINQYKAECAQLEQRKNELISANEIEQAAKLKMLNEVRVQAEKELKQKNVKYEELNLHKEKHQKLKVEHEELLKTIEISKSNISNENVSLAQITNENESFESANAALKNQINELLKAIEDTKEKNTSEETAAETAQEKLRNSISEFAQKRSNMDENHEKSCAAKKQQFAEERTELENALKSDVEALKKSNAELAGSNEEFAEGNKLLESNLDGLSSECDVISRKVLVLERSLVEEKRKRRAAQPPQRLQPPKRSFDAMSDSSDDRPTAMDILLQKRQMQIRKAQATKRRH